MKTTSHFTQAPRSERAFTILEIWIAMTLFTMIGGALLYTHIMGLKIYGLMEAKMGASQDTRMAFNLLSFEVHTADRMEIGTGSSNAFTKVATNALHVGNAIQIYLSTNSTPFIRYYLDTTSGSASYGKLHRRSTNGTITVIAENITNYPSSSHPTNPSPFALEYFQGGVVTDEQPGKQMVLNVNFVFYQAIRTNALYDFYQYRTKITPRIH